MDVLGFEERGIQFKYVVLNWIPAFAGMTVRHEMRIGKSKPRPLKGSTAPTAKPPHPTPPLAAPPDRPARAHTD